MEKSKHYLLFTGYNYYPKGGMRDFLFKGSLEECKNKFESTEDDDSWAHVVDSDTFEIILYGLIEDKKVGFLWNEDKEMLRDLYDRKWVELYPP